MNWIVIALILIVAFGPILWLVPSKRDRRLSALRARARSEGLTVEIRRIPKPDPDPAERVSAGGRVREPVIECAAYTLNLPVRLVHLPVFRLVHRPPDDGPDPFECWQYAIRPKGEGRRYLDDVLTQVARLLDRLPAGVLALELESGRVVVFWREPPSAQPDDVTELAVALREFGAGLVALDAEIEARRADPDS